MAHQLTEWEAKKLQEKKVVEEAAEAREKRAFIKRWVSATPKKQAEILWEIHSHVAANAIAPIPVELMRF